MSPWIPGQNLTTNPQRKLNREKRIREKGTNKTFVITNSVKPVLSNCISLHCTPYFVFQFFSPFINSYDCTRSNEYVDQREFSNRAQKCLSLPYVNSFTIQKASPDLFDATIAFDTNDTYTSRGYSM